MPSDTVHYIGVNDRSLDLFEGQYRVANGMAYNSYVIIDQKIAVMDAVDANATAKWLDKLATVLGDRTPDYLIVQHMEPDHSAGIRAFASTYPKAMIVSTAKSFAMMQQFFKTDFAARRHIVADGDTLVLGRHTLSFYTAPMVHWPEVMVTYDRTDKILFSADAFGKFGALDAKEDWIGEARRYYFGIVGKYGVQVQAALKKLGDLDIQTICPLHGPILRENLPFYLELYHTWSSYGAESDGVLLCYTSVYGNTKTAVWHLEEDLRQLGCERVVLRDLARSDMSEVVADAFRYGKLVLATTTYNGEVFPFMREFLCELAERSFQNRTIGIIENGSWAPMAAKTIRKRLDTCSHLTFLEPTITIHGAVSQENRRELKALAHELMR